VEKMRKILLCGASEFLMSNVIRYMSYRTKEYEFVSIDALKNKENYKSIYINRNHKFYIGDSADKNFMDRLIFIEKPDVIINGMNDDYVGLLENYVEYQEHKTNCSSVTLGEYGIPVIQLTNPEKYNNSFKNICYFTFKNNGVILEVPNCFGIRQKTNFGFAKIIKDSINQSEMKTLITKVKASSKSGKWVYAEDIASFIWFIMEQDFFGKESKVMRVPNVGWFSTEDMVKVVEEVLNKKINYENVEPWKNFIYDYEQEYNCEWKPDTYDFNGNLRKTIGWYLVNRWSLKD
jgi:dTDP-D-glucose 4,6-dehydratase